MGLFCIHKNYFVSYDNVWNSTYDAVKCRKIVVECMHDSSVFMEREVLKLNYKVSVRNK